MHVSAVLCCTVLYSAVLCCIVVCCTVMYCTVLCYTMWCAVLYYVMCYTMWCAVLWCAVLYCTYNAKNKWPFCIKINVSRFSWVSSYLNGERTRILRLLLKLLLMHFKNRPLFVGSCLKRSSWGEFHLCSYADGCSGV